MPRSTEGWRDYVTAARRKLDIARFHRDRLESELGSPSLSGVEVPPIPVQAHFEGVVISLMAAVDQIAQAANSALGLRLSANKLIEGAFGQLGETLPGLKDWFSEEIGRDLRRIRVRVIHYSYIKSPAEDRWRVESAGTGYGGPRELLAYASAGVVYGQRLGSLLSDIEATLASLRERENEDGGA